ncbi:MAG TPA: peptide ABC transporter substrate-binding protein [Gemmatimonadaceae bacterium]|nr:peptide ABC transporter substrate-binding protein [Gemmatimonadaceae bacterium]
MLARTRTSISSAVLGLSFMVCGACSGSPRPVGTVVFASGTDLESANPLVTIHPLSRQVQRFVLFTTLARYDSTLAPEPYGAKSWTFSADKRELTFHLVGALRWHDGRRTTSHDVAFTMLAARDPRTGYARAGDLAALDTVIAPDDSTAVLRFHSAQPEFPLVLCELPILPEHLLRAVPRPDMRRAAFNLAPVGNGPFKFVERVAGQRWVFARNDGFPAALGGPPGVEQLVIAVVDEPTTKFAGLTSGDLDFAGIAPTMAALAQRDPTMRVLDYPVLQATGLVFNTHRAPLDDVRVRRAISLSIDRERIVKAALAGYATAASGPVAPDSPFALAGSSSANTGEADSLFDAAGWRRGPNGARSRDGRPMQIELLTVGSGDQAVEQLVQADLAARGVRIEIRVVEFGSFLARARATPKTFDMLLTGIPGDISLAYLTAMYDGHQRGSALDYADFHSPRLDSLFGRARLAPTRDASVLAWHGVQEELAREMPAAWIYHSRGLQGIARRMQHVSMDLRGELASLTRWSATGGPGAH